MEDNKIKLMIIEDNRDLLFNFKLMLEDHDFNVKTAKNGIDALETLSKDEELPDIVICDIIMPEMNGYEFLKRLSSDFKYSHIPFIILTALTTHKDVQYAKELGADDFLRKPIEELELIKTINEKVKEKSIAKEIERQFHDNNLSNRNLTEMQLNNDMDSIYLLLVAWDDRVGPELKQICSLNNQTPSLIDGIALQLFYAANLIYGHKFISESESLLLNLKNIEKNCFLFVDSYPAPNERHLLKIFMLVVIAPFINYYNSLRIKSVFNNISKEIKSTKTLDSDFDLKKYWGEILNILNPEFKR